MGETRLVRDSAVASRYPLGEDDTIACRVIEIGISPFLHATVTQDVDR